MPPSHPPLPTVGTEEEGGSLRSLSSQSDRPRLPLPDTSLATFPVREGEGTRGWNLCRRVDAFKRDNQPWLTFVSFITRGAS